MLKIFFLNKKKKIFLPQTCQYKFKPLHSPYSDFSVSILLLESAHGPTNVGILQLKICIFKFKKILESRHHQTWSKEMLTRTFSSLVRQLSRISTSSRYFSIFLGKEREREHHQMSRGEDFHNVPLIPAGKPPNSRITVPSNWAWTSNQLTD